MKLARQEAEEFLYKEARLLDKRRYEEWLELFTADGLYWIPMVDGSDPEQEPSVLYDDSELRQQRVYQLLYQHRFAQQPPSRTVHTISNVLVDETEGEDDVLVHCNLNVFELREGDPLQLGLGEQRAFAGHCQYTLRKEAGKWLIAMRKVLLINREVPIINLSFIL